MNEPFSVIKLAPAARNVNVGLICSRLRRTTDREAIADAMTEVAALPCSPEGLLLRSSVAAGGGLESVKTALLAAHGDVRLQCKAANALASLCMSEEVARGFSAAPNSSAVVDRLGDMLRSRSQWAQADAAGCLGWLIGNIEGTALHEIVPFVTQLMVKYTITDDEVFIREERQRSERGSWRRNRISKAGDNRGGGGGGGVGRSSGGSKESNQDEADQEQARERMDTIRVYTLIFLLKASHTDPSTMPAMVEAGAIPGLLRHLASAREESPYSQQQRQWQQQQQQENPAVHEGFHTRQKGRIFGGHRHRTDEDLDHEQKDQSSPSFLLAARLLYAFSVDSSVRKSLLEAKCLPPLIRIRRRLQAAEAAAAAAGTAAGSTVEPELACIGTKDLEGKTALLAGKGALAVEEEGADLGNQTAHPSSRCTAAGNENSSCSERGVKQMDGESGQPPLEAMVGFLVDQLVGRASPASGH
ncbi:unnamed protein product [Pylaiella littoralis]